MKAAVGEIRPAEGPLSGVVRVPGDKSISHRMALVAAFASGPTIIRGFSGAGDCAATLALVRALGVDVSVRGSVVTIDGKGWEGLTAPGLPLDCGRSGTTMRLACGVLAGAGLGCSLTGDPQLLARPMERVAEPLREMGARIETSDGKPPVRMAGRPLQGIDYEMPVASAQVKSAILLAGLRATGRTSVTETVTTRDHTERLLGWLELPLRRDGSSVSVDAAQPEGFEAEVPGDFSSAAPLLAAAAAVPGSVVTVEGVGLNPTRAELLYVLTRMGAAVLLEDEVEEGPEQSARVTVEGFELHGVEVGGEEVPLLIDELPLVGVLGALAEGTTVVKGAEELRVKESDRISGIVAGLRELGAEAEELADGFAVTGPAKLRGGTVDSLGDHRLAMAFSVAALAADGPVAIEGLGSISDSFPGFLETLESLR